MSEREAPGARLASPELCETCGYPLDSFKHARFEAKGIGGHKLDANAMAKATSRRPR